MKKLTFKAFTLVEMLIVIVIIGILIAALLPRLQGAQGMARDTARQTALSQLQAAIVTYQSLNGNRPHGSGTTGDPASNAINTNELVKLVTSNIMSGLPTDPNLGNEWTGMNNNYVGTGGGFQYLVLAKNTVKKAGFILMAKTEIPGKSNWVMQQENCDSGAGKPTQDDWCINKDSDLSNISPCKGSIELTENLKASTSWDQACTYQNPSQLFYIITY